MHSISWLEPDSHERSDSVHHTCSMLQGVDRQPLPQSLRENRRRILHEEEQLPDLHRMQVRVESLHLGKIALDDPVGHKNSSAHLQFRRR